MTISFGCDSYVGMAWGIMSGANTFTVALRISTQTPELLGDETNRLHVMWNEYQVAEKK
jgi:hypothetical protein